MGVILTDGGERLDTITQCRDGFIDNYCFFKVLLTANFIVIRSLRAGQINQSEFLTVTEGNEISYTSNKAWNSVLYIQYIYVCMYRVYVFSGMYVASVMVVRFGKIYYTIYIRLEAYIYNYCLNRTPRMCNHRGHINNRD